MSPGEQRPDLLVGCAAGGSGDRTDAARPIVDELIANGGRGVLVFENLAERTLALAQLAKRANPQLGYEPLLEAELRPVLADCLRHGIAIVSNFGAANPKAAAALIQRLAAELGCPSPRIAVIEGDDLSDEAGQRLLQTLLPAEDRRRLLSPQAFVSANVYLGAFEIAQALRAGAQIVVSGRVADPALVLGPAIAHFDWTEEDLDKLAGATMAGHLLECGAQVTGGYFADPGRKEVEDLAHVGYPIAQIRQDGSFVITKPSGTGGVVEIRTVKEQLLYEVHDPAAYLTPDVTADIMQAELRQIGPNRVEVRGVRGHARPPTLKALVYFEGGWLGEAEISYAGPHAEARARLAMEVVRQRMGQAMALRFDLIGSLSVFGDDGGHGLAELAAGEGPDHADIRLRVAGRHADSAEIDRMLREVYSLWLCGPAGGGGVRTAKRQRLSNVACYVPRDLVAARFRILE
ncbi:acyclic terpene utilization AtuA family protein [Bordetella sp. N]|uniref:acyclic terpene utilization AtuA family protein n=1 Tax=Bordetella sp. N TaxID=1746199 RepID=UPI00070E3B68|nr:acyclic terpene utilization AtuA family protein [Bordetella sp. N]ALM87295.1 hypothetical protein ASB57_26720 [Bordetella sp. N]